MTRLSEDTLADIQGFITTGYGHLPLAAYLFLQIRDARRAQEWLAQAIPAITTSAPWPVTPEGVKLKPVSAVNIAFTAPGLAALRLPHAVQCTFPNEFQDGITTPERSAILGDTEESSPDQWEVGGPTQPALHIIVLVHAATAADLDSACTALRERIGAAAGGVIELSDRRQNGYRPDTGTEPFGFHDGIAQPSMAGITGDGVPTGEFILGYPNHYDNIPPTPVVADELEGSAVLPLLANPYHQGRRLRDLGQNGSFVVYRKLRQDVAGFWQFMKREAIRATGREDAPYMVWIASRCVGRWPAGAPLAISPDHDDPQLSDRNDFRYAADVDGLSCPLGAHVRRANPRDVIPPYPAAQSSHMSEAHRLLRRGRAFGPPLFDALALRDPAASSNASTLVNLRDDGVARGIHFFCVNASIKSQFEFVQQTWCNNPRFGGLYDNSDPVTGDNAGADRPSSHMAIPHRPLAVRTAAVPRFVIVKGGAYFFMPSISALKFLAAFRA